MGGPSWLKKQKFAENFKIISGYDPYLSGHMDIDPKGYFLIRLNREMKEIETAHCTNDHMITLMVKGKTAQEIYMKIIELGLISLLDHAAYLGKELRKAEDALNSGKEYIQDG